MPFLLTKKKHIECKLAYCSKAVHKKSIPPHFRKLFCTSCKCIIPNILIQPQELQAPVCAAGIVKPYWGHSLVTSFQNTQEKWWSSWMLLTQGNFWQDQGKQEGTELEITSSIPYFSHGHVESLHSPVQDLCPILQHCSASHLLKSQLGRIAPLSHPSKNFVAAVLLFHIYFLKNNLPYRNLSDYMKSSVLKDFKICYFHLGAMSLD